MPNLLVDDAEIARARALASNVTDGVLGFVRRNTTVSIERTVLRLFGIAGAGPRGVPLVNMLVDKLHASQVLHRGAAWWLGRALLM
ncbi:MAG: lysine 5,6-aminomutase subunit alpha TIM-barrel domain-containing protein, partial [Myxococcales bacterium]